MVPEKVMHFLFQRMRLFMSSMGIKKYYISKGKTAMEMSGLKNVKMEIMKWYSSIQLVTLIK